MHRTIVVAAGQGEALEDAFALGVQLARPRGACLLVTRVALGREDLPRDPQLDDVATRCPHDVPVEVRVVRASTVVRGLHDTAAAEQADALVVGFRRFGRTARLVGGDLAVRVVHDAPCPVAAASRGYAARADHRTRRVGVAWDGGDGPSAEALEWAVQLAERLAAELRIIYVMTGLADERLCAARLDEVRRAACARTPAGAVMRTGDPAREILEEARELDLLVLGSRVRGPLGRILLGSVSIHALEHAPCPVVVLPRGVRAPAETTV